MSDYKGVTWVLLYIYVNISQAGGNEKILFVEVEQQNRKRS